jgi:PP-loop family
MRVCSVVSSTEQFLKKHMETLKAEEGSKSAHRQTIRKGVSSQDSPGVRSSGSSVFRGRLPVDPIPARSLDYLNSLEPVAVSLSGGMCEPASESMYIRTYVCMIDLFCPIRCVCMYDRPLPPSLTYSPPSLPSSPLVCLGVDSMVIAKILVHLRQTDRLPLGRIIAIHIDYANRAESAMEAQFVRDWCADLGIECFVRVVDEVTRGRCVHS